MPVIAVPISRLILARKKWISSGMSLRRSRSGGTCDRHDVQAEVEVLAEAPLLARRASSAWLVAATMRHVDLRSALAAAEARDLALLQHAQQLGLQLERHVGDLVEQQRAALGDCSNLPARLLGGAGEGAALVAEQLALEQLARDRRAVERDERPAASAASGSGSTLAISSLPVPLSPWISTVASVFATRPMVL